MIEAFQKDDELLNEIRKSPSFDNVNSEGPQAESFRIWWLGQSGFLVQFKGEHLLFDPYLSDSLTRKYAETDKPHVRMTEQAIDPSRMDFVDVVTSSHNHTDHLDGETLTKLLSANPKLNLIVPDANLEFAAERLQVPVTRLTGIGFKKQIQVGHFELFEIPAAHEQIERDENGNLKCVGLVAKFGRWSVYHSGDTMMFDAMDELIRPFDVDLALLPINGRRPERRVAGNLDGVQAAELAHSIGATCVIPCHYDMFEFNTESPDAFVEKCESMGQGYCVLKSGESFHSKELE